MLENFFPVVCMTCCPKMPSSANVSCQDAREKSSAGYRAISTNIKKHRKPADNEPDVTTQSTGAWSTEVGVHIATWNVGNGMAHAGLLASGSQSGLCRIDFLEGKWSGRTVARIPYGSIENIRGEGMNIDDEGLEEEEESE
jgi:hypothetical protein